MDNPYKILGLSRTANLDLARSKYIQLSKKFHPDISKYTLLVSESKMKQINSAYSLIKTSIAKGIISYRPKGRFTKDEINELIERFKEGQTLYKIGRDKYPNLNLYYQLHFQMYDLSSEIDGYTNSSHHIHPNYL